jgi:hypothetical protein
MKVLVVKIIWSSFEFGMKLSEILDLFIYILFNLCFRSDCTEEEDEDEEELSLDSDSELHTIFFLVLNSPEILF